MTLYVYAGLFRDDPDDDADLLDRHVRGYVGRKWASTGPEASDGEHEGEADMDGELR